MMRRLFAKTTILTLLALLGTGCGWLSKDEDELKPARLVDFDAEIELQRLWSVNVGNGQGKKYNRLRPVITQNRIYVAANDGTVMALNREDGQRLWRSRLRDAVVTGGVGFGGNMLLLGLEDARLLALSAETGEVLWEVSATSEILSAPQYSGGRVVVQTVDGKLIAFNSTTGERVWIYESAVPALSLRGTTTPLIQGNFVMTGFGNGSVVSVALDNGTLRWEQRVAVPTGRSEIERLVDVDGELRIQDGSVLIVPAYQGYLTALDLNTGQIRWRARESSAHGTAAGFGNIYVSSAGGLVRAYRLSQEDPVWENAALARRQLSGPVAFNNYVAVGDFDGYVHFLSQVDGHFAARIRPDKKGVRSVMQTRSNTLYIYGNGGNLSAYTLR